jgi:sugar/nucleoside kinase (ribokinase family)
LLVVPYISCILQDCEKGYFSFAAKQVQGSAKALQGCSRELINFLSKKPKSMNIVVTPDFFMDRLIDLDYDPEHFSSEVAEIVERKGGSIDQVSQTDQRGGNAINVASALLALGAKVTPIVCTSKLGLEQIRFHFQEYDVDTSHVKTFSEASVTTALEFKTSSGKANVMLRDLGSLADFGPSDLTEEDYKLIEDADYVCLFNWAGTQKHGTRLVETVFKRAKAKGNCKTFLDTADPLPNEDEIPRLIEKVLETDRVDILSVNENEAVTFASLISNEICKQRKKIEFNELALLSAQILAKHLRARIDLHTTTFSVTVKTEGAVFVPAFKVKPLRATGAGDAWDAGNIVGDANGLSDECRLTLANAVSACYLSDPEGVHPTRQKLAKFLRKAEMIGR